MTYRSITATAILVTLLLTAGGGCASQGGAGERSGRTWTPSVKAWCDPPPGWVAQPLKTSPQHTHQIWLNPDGTTAYGVIHFSLPLPVGPDLVLWGFIREMRRTEGAAEVVYQQPDPALPGTRFIAQGKIYRIRGNLMIDGWEGWVVYAGTQGDHVNEPALRTAASAREGTEVANGTAGRPAPK